MFMNVTDNYVHKEQVQPYPTDCCMERYTYEHVRVAEYYLF